MVLLVDLFLDDGGVMELDVVQQEPLHSIVEDAFDISFLDILIQQRAKKTGIRFVFQHQLAHEMMRHIILFRSFIIALFLYQNFMYYLDFLSIRYLVALQLLIRFPLLPKFNW